MTGFSLNDLEAIVAARAADESAKSYTRQLLEAGRAKSAKKLGEEAVELALASVVDDRENAVYEAADLLYHLMVVLKSLDIPLHEVMAELERRTVQSGLDEKASRGALD